MIKLNTFIDILRDQIHNEEESLEEEPVPFIDEYQFSEIIVQIQDLFQAKKYDSVITKLNECIPSYKKNEVLFSNYLQNNDNFYGILAQLIRTFEETPQLIPICKFCILLSNNTPNFALYLTCHNGISILFYLIKSDIHTSYMVNIKIYSSLLMFNLCPDCPTHLFQPSSRIRFLINSHSFWSSLVCLNLIRFGYSNNVINFDPTFQNDLVESLLITLQAGSEATIVNVIWCFYYIFLSISNQIAQNSDSIQIDSIFYSSKFMNIMLKCLLKNEPHEETRFFPQIALYILSILLLGDISPENIDFYFKNIPNEIILDFMTSPDDTTAELAFCFAQNHPLFQLDQAIYHISCQTLCQEGISFKKKKAALFLLSSRFKSINNKNVEEEFSAEIFQKMINFFEVGGQIPYEILELIIQFSNWEWIKVICEQNDLQAQIIECIDETGDSKLASLGQQVLAFLNTV